MPQETRTRVTLLLPKPESPAEFLLVDDVLTELIHLCGGITMSAEMPPMFNGKWINSLDGQVVSDEIWMIIADFAVPSSAPSLAAYLDRVKRDCQTGLDEEIIWITTEDIKRINTDDFVR